MKLDRYRDKNQPMPQAEISLKFIENLTCKLLFFFSGASTAITGTAFVVYVIKEIMK